MEDKENKKEVCEGGMCHGGGCGGGVCHGGMCGWGCGRHRLIRLFIGILVFILIFFAGFKLGESKGYFNSEFYGGRIPRGPYFMMREGYFGQDYYGNTTMGGSRAGANQQATTTSR